MAEYSNEVRFAFAKKLLKEHGEWLQQQFVDALNENGNVRSGELEGAISFDETSEGGNAGLQFKFFDYGRFFEIAGYKKKKSKWPENENKLNWILRGELPTRKKKSKKTAWYAKNMYGGLGRLASRISAGLSDEELARIKAEIEQGFAEAKRAG